MPILFLIAGPTHKDGTHTIHTPKLDPETGRPVAGINSIVFEGGRANIDDVGTAKWLTENGHASLLDVPAYGLCQPGTGPVFAYGEGGEAIEVAPAQPAALPPVVADKATAKEVK